MLSRSRVVGITAALGAGALLLLQGAPSTAHGGGGSEDLLRSGVAASLSPQGPTLFGVRPGGAPWVTDPGDIRVDDDGELRADIEGLIIPTQGRNPVAFIAASLVCNGMIVDTTTPVPFSEDGDAEIRETVSVPDNCLAPAVLLNPAQGGVANTTAYIAASGN